ncbi:MAG: hypothetical protein Q4B71_01700 [Cardiobacteriaceae bacterium]|nr:hypothetical protein [Cardiobacteriaceae bacterium]
MDEKKDILKDGLVIIFTMMACGVAWLGSGYYLWKMIGVDGFGSAIIWLFAWPILASAAKFVTVGVIVFVDNFFDKLFR